MNERIRELLSQAGVHYEVLPKDTVYEKFAELIVQECLRQTKEVVIPITADAIESKIKEHFGVE
jgi:uncharacterized protein YqgV (UPF0045/DUF77 family)